MAASCHPGFRKNYLLLLFILLLLVSFAALNLGTALFTSSYKIDLTADRRYTLSPESVNWLRQNQTPLSVRLYLSPDLAASYPALAQYAAYVVRFLEQYKNFAGNRLSLEIIETTPFSNEENDAKRLGIRPFMDKNGQNSLYFGAVFSDHSGQSYTIPYLEPQRRAYLEHDVSRILSKLPGYQAPVIGVMSPLLDVIDTGETFNNRQDWPFVRHLKQDYNVEYIRSDKVQIPLRIQTLIVYNPQGLGRLAMYALDQYLLRGGSLIIFLDPFSEAFLNQNGYINSAPSGFAGFLKNLGIDYDDSLLVGDASQSQNALITRDSASQLQNYPLWLELTASNINQQTPLTAGLQKLRLNSAGTFSLKDNSDYQAAALFATSEQGGSIEADIAKYSSKSVVKENYRLDNRRYPLAVLVEGKFLSYFDSHPLKDSSYQNMLFPFLGASLKPGRLLLVADSDMLFYPHWTQSVPFSGQSPYDYVPFNNNIDFLERAVDFLSNNKALLSIAPKGFAQETSPGDSLRRQLENAAADRIELYTLSMNQARYEQEQLKEKIKNQEVFPSVAVIKQMENLQREALSNQEKLKAAQYAVSKELSRRTNLIIAANVLVFPAVLIALLWLINFLMRRRIRKQAERYIND